MCENNRKHCGKEVLERELKDLETDIGGVEVDFKRLQARGSEDNTSNNRGGEKPCEKLIKDGNI